MQKLLMKSKRFLLLWPIAFFSLHPIIFATDKSDGKIVLSEKDIEWFHGQECFDFLKKSPNPRVAVIHNLSLWAKERFGDKNHALTTSISKHITICKRWLTYVNQKPGMFPSVDQQIDFCLQLRIATQKIWEKNRIETTDKETFFFDLLQFGFSLQDLRSCRTENPFLACCEDVTIAPHMLNRFIYACGAFVDLYTIKDGKLTPCIALIIDKLTKANRLIFSKPISFNILGWRSRECLPLHVTKNFERVIRPMFYSTKGTISYSKAKNDYQALCIHQQKLRTFLLASKAFSREKNLTLNHCLVNEKIIGSYLADPGEETNILVKFKETFVGLRNFIDHCDYVKKSFSSQITWLKNHDPKRHKRLLDFLQKPELFEQKYNSLL